MRLLPTALRGFLLTKSFGGCHGPSQRFCCAYFSTESGHLAREEGVLISSDEVEHIANLACLDLDKAGGVENMKRELSSLLEFVAVMDKVDTTGVSPMWTPVEQDVTSPLREDTPQELGVTGPQLLDLAANTRPPYYTVPKGKPSATDNS